MQMYSKYPYLCLHSCAHPYSCVHLHTRVSTRAQIIARAYTHTHTHTRTDLDIHVYACNDWPWPGLRLFAPLHVAKPAVVTIFVSSNPSRSSHTIDEGWIAGKTTCICVCRINYEHISTKVFHNYCLPFQKPDLALTSLLHFGAMY